MSQAHSLEQQGSAGLARGLTVLQSQRLSRAGLVYGSSFSRGSLLDAAVRRQLAEPNDMWYDIDRFQLDHINEVLVKLNDASLDDEIWGKIVVMERGKRIAKAYLRKTTIIVDGGDEEFDGKTLGFNFFPNPFRDEYTEELRSKIGDGVILKIDNQGNIKAMARGSTPIFVQGWREAKSSCIPDKVVRMHGKLSTKTPSCTNDDDRIFKVFDMRRFKQAVERDPYETETDAKNLLMKTCVRLALVKDGGSNDPMKTPCWFMVINLVALDMLKTKLPSVCVSAVLTSANSGMVESNRLSRILSQTSLVPPSDLYSNPALTQLLAAAVQHANSQYGTMSTSLSAASLPAALNVDQIAKLANSLSLATNNANVNAIAQVLNPTSSGGKRPQRRQDYIKSTRVFSDSEDDMSDGEPKSVSNHTPREYSGSTTGSSSGISGIGMRKDRNKPRNTTKSMEVLAEKTKSEEESMKQKKENKVYTKSNRPRLSDAVFEDPIPKESSANAKSLPKTWKSCASTTSDYDSNKEVFDSGSWSSQSRVSSANSQDEHRTTSPSSVLSETENSHSLKTGNPQPTSHEPKQKDDLRKEIQPTTTTPDTTDYYNRRYYNPPINPKTYNHNHNRYQAKLNNKKMLYPIEKPRRATLPRQHVSPTPSVRITRQLTNHHIGDRTTTPHIRSYGDHQRRHSELETESLRSFGRRVPVSSGTTVIASTIEESEVLMATLTGGIISRSVQDVQIPSGNNTTTENIQPTNTHQESQENNWTLYRAPSRRLRVPYRATTMRRQQRPMQRSQSAEKEVRQEINHQHTTANNNHNRSSPTNNPRPKRGVFDADNPTNKETGSRSGGEGNQLSFGTRASQNKIDYQPTKTPHQDHLSLQRNHRYRQNCRIQRTSGGLIYEEPCANKTQRAKSPTPYTDSKDSRDDHLPSELPMCPQSRRNLHHHEETLLYHQQHQLHNNNTNTNNQRATASIQFHECPTQHKSESTTNRFSPTFSQPRDGGHYGRASIGFTDDAQNRVQQRITVFEKQTRDPKNIYPNEPTTTTAAIQSRTPTNVAPAPPTPYRHEYGTRNSPTKMEINPVYAGPTNPPPPTNHFNRYIPYEANSNKLSQPKQQQREPLPIVSPKQHDAQNHQPTATALRNSELANQAAAAAIWRRRRNGPWDQLLTRAQAGLPNHPTGLSPTENTTTPTTHGYQHTTWSPPSKLETHPYYESRWQKSPIIGTPPTTNYNPTEATHLEIDEQGTIRRRAVAFRQQQQQTKTHPRVPASIPNTGSVRTLRDYYSDLQARSAIETHPQLSPVLKATHEYHQGHPAYCTTNRSPPSYQRFNGPLNNVTRLCLPESKLRENIYEAPPTPPTRYSSMLNQMTCS